MCGSRDTMVCREPGVRRSGSAGRLSCVPLPPEWSLQRASFDTDHRESESEPPVSQGESRLDERPPHAVRRRSRPADIWTVARQSSRERIDVGVWGAVHPDPHAASAAARKPRGSKGGRASPCQPPCSTRSRLAYAPQEREPALADASSNAAPGIARNCDCALHSSATIGYSPAWARSGR